MNAERLAPPAAAGLALDRLERVAAWMRQQIDAGRLAGIEVMLVRRGLTVFHRCAGLADIARSEPATPATLYRIYSMSKPLTSAAIMMLYEEGGFQLDDPIARFIPEFANPRVWSRGAGVAMQTEPARRGITFRDLLTHTSGLTYGFMQAHPVDALYRAQELDGLGTDLTLEDMTRKLAPLPLLAHPGTRWSYSMATDVLARLAEVVSGQRFDVFLTERLLQPLGMTDTTFNVPAGKAGRFAACYVRGPDGAPELQDDPRTSRFTKPVRAPFGGALVSTASDYMKFCRFMLGNGALNGTRLLGRKTVELMTMNHLDDDMAAMGQPRFAESSSHGIGFGLGFSVLLDPAKAQITGSVGECAWGGIASTAFWIDPREELAAVMMTQLMPSSQYPLRRELRALAYQAIVEHCTPCANVR